MELTFADSTLTTPRDLRLFDPKIFRGVETDDFPEVCLLTSMSTRLGTGVVLHANIVVTAKHVANHRPTDAIFPVRSNSPVGPGARHPVLAIKNSASMDVSVLLLQNHDGLPFAVPAFGSTEDLVRSTEAGGTMVGFGASVADESDADDSPKRRSIAPLKTVLDPSPSTTADPAFEFLVPAAPSGICIRDSGGPFYLADGASRVLLGIAKGRVPSSTLPPCGRDSIYTRIDRCADFIRNAGRCLGVVINQ